MLEVVVVTTLLVVVVVDSSTTLVDDGIILVVSTGIVVIVTVNGLTNVGVISIGEVISVVSVISTIVVIKILLSKMGVTVVSSSGSGVIEFIEENEFISCAAVFNRLQKIA